MTDGPLFRRILAVHTQQRVDRDLLDYAALLASSDSGTGALVVAFPSDSVLRSLAPTARAIFKARQAGSVSLRLATAPELDWVFDAAVEFGADLIVMRRPRNGRQGRTMARRLLSEAPCSICLVPPNVAPCLERVVAGVDLSPRSRTLLASAARFCVQSGAEGLIALHSCFRDTLCDSQDFAESYRNQRLLNLYQLLPRSGIADLELIPSIKESPSHDRALLRAVREHSAHLIVVGRWGLPPLLLARPSRETENLLWHCPVPLLQVLLSQQPVPFLRALRTRLFPLVEPTYN
jgi:nucleotide-binding universal stress UspA family protein